MWCAVWRRPLACGRREVSQKIDGQKLLLRVTASFRRTWGVSDDFYVTESLSNDGTNR